jgi:hypothetical protein
VGAEEVLWVAAEDNDSEGAWRSKEEAEEEEDDEEEVGSDGGGAIERRARDERREVAERYDGW